MAFERDPHKLFPHDHLLKYTVIPLLPNFITPNIITVVRFVLTPFVVWCLAAEDYAVGIPLFLFAAFTDALDGSLARVRQKITAWGTFYDPGADKLLIGSLVLLFVTKYLGVVFSFLILFFELLIVFFGYINRKNGRLVSANIFGKTKMLFQVLGLATLLISLALVYLFGFTVAAGFFVLAIILAVNSLFTYGL